MCVTVGCRDEDYTRFHVVLYIGRRRRRRRSTRGSTRDDDARHRDARRAIEGARRTRRATTTTDARAARVDRARTDDARRTIAREGTAIEGTVRLPRWRARRRATTTTRDRGRDARSIERCERCCGTMTRRGGRSRRCWWSGRETRRRTRARWRDGWARAGDARRRRCARSNARSNARWARRRRWGRWDGRGRGRGGVEARRRRRRGDAGRTLRTRSRRRWRRCARSRSMKAAVRSSTRSAVATTTTTTRDVRVARTRIWSKTKTRAITRVAARIPSVYATTSTSSVGCAEDSSVYIDSRRFEANVAIRGRRSVIASSTRASTRPRRRSSTPRADWMKLNKRTISTSSGAWTTKLLKAFITSSSLGSPSSATPNERCLS